MEPIHCVVFPRSDLAPVEFKALGEALHRWADDEEENGLGILLDGDVLLDLQQGEPPRPLGMQGAQTGLVTTPGGQWERPGPAPRSVGQAKDKLGAAPSVRAVQIRIVQAPGGRARVVDGLRRLIPQHLVEDITIDNVSWTA